MDRFTFEDAILRQFAAQLSRNKYEYYTSSYTVDYKNPIENRVALEPYASWRILHDYDYKPSITVRIRRGNKTMGAQLCGLPAVSITGVEDGVPVTDYEDAVAQTEYLIEGMRRELLNNLAADYKKCLDACMKIPTKLDSINGEG